VFKNDRTDAPIKRTKCSANSEAATSLNASHAACMPACISARGMSAPAKNAASAASLVCSELSSVVRH
jgi:hypothetical protein